LGWVPRASTRAAQKTPVDAEQKIFELFVRLSLMVRDSGVRHPDLLVNFDQTQVVMADNTANTFEVRGAKQVSVLGKEEKRAFTAVVGVSASGDLLPMQFIFKGGSHRSLPSSHAPSMDEATRLGFVYSWNSANYWSSLPTMAEYMERIVVPHFARAKQLHGYADDQDCAVILDCWSVHRSEAFRQLVRGRWPWIRLLFIPGGTT
ncbi:hypothetical protein CONPUDRAFT_28001, partial [Coniophora puteana RWD-64-598 SS2]